MRLIILILFSFITLQTLGQGDTTNQVKPNYNDSIVTIKGRVVDTTQNINYYNVMVINRTEGKGIFGSYDGTFNIKVKKSDVVAVSVTGYQTEFICFEESDYKPEYNVTIYLEMLSVTGKTVEVKRVKTLEELQKERAAIAKREVPTLSGINALESPITALYMQFSKREKTKRLIAEMEYNDQKRAVVKEILRLYVHSDIIDLPDDEFDAFISFLNLNDQFLKTATDYELITYIKGKYEHYKKLKAEGF